MAHRARSRNKLDTCGKSQRETKKQTTTGIVTDDRDLAFSHREAKSDMRKQTQATATAIISTATATTIAQHKKKQKTLTNRHKKIPRIVLITATAAEATLEIQKDSKKQTFK